MIFQEKIFTEEECEKIINFQNTYTDLPYRDREIYIDIENHRIDQLVKTIGEKKFGKFFNVWDIPNDENTEWMFNKLTNWFSKISEIKLSNKKIIGCALHKYSKGDLFMRHSDISNMFYDRRWNLGIQLNNDYIGGDYICYYNDTEFHFLKDKGTAIAYKADIEHEIKEIIDGERWSIVLALCKNDIIDKKQNLF